MRVMTLIGSVLIPEIILMNLTPYNTKIGVKVLRWLSLKKYAPTKITTEASNMDIKNKILESIKYATDELGYTLISEDWGTATHKCACPMGCVLLQDNPKDVVRIEDSQDNETSAAEILGVDLKWITSFIDGYDGNGSAGGSEAPEAWKMGDSIAT